ncbi:MAG: YihY/virulence factor BrkB family protein [Hyphomicrobiales bacterium]|nr:YihY/virulence factor BrkB family protein [Hyphomicrobiales bacterium]
MKLYKFAILVFHILRLALKRFSRDDGWAFASHVALSVILALFPFLIFGAALAAFLGSGDFSETAVHVIFDAWPQSIAEPLIGEIRNVLTNQRGDLLTYGALGALIFASNGVEALRVALNRAYRVKDNRGWIKTRLQSLLFVFIGCAVLLSISFFLVLLPLAKSLATKHAPWIIPYLELGGYQPELITITVLIIGLFVCHKWLPAGNRTFRSMLPGIMFTLMCWIPASLGFASYLEGFSTYVSTYAGLAGIMIALVFLYMIAAIFIIGAEINSAAARITSNQSSLSVSG